MVIGFITTYAIDWDLDNLIVCNSKRMCNPLHFLSITIYDKNSFYGQISGANSNSENGISVIKT
jgi:hypothetical protein